MRPSRGSDGMIKEQLRALSRRAFLGKSLTGIGGMALASLLRSDSVHATQTPRQSIREPGMTPRARRVIFLFMFGGPSHMDLFDPKPRLRELQGQELPASVRGNERFSANANRQGR